MGTLLFEKVTADVEKTSFDCGIGSINEYVKESYYPAIVQHAYAYSIMDVKHKILGYYQVLFREIEINDFPDDIADYDPEIKGGTISSIHIRFIAIDKKYHKHGIGTSSLRVIIKNIMEVTEFFPIRVITIDARSDLIEWYRKLGFQEMIKNTVGQEGITKAMYFDCLRYVDELNIYLEKHI
jgi:hypothetical protein